MQLTASNVRLVAIVLTALCAVSGGIYLVFCKRKDYRRAFAYKGTAGLCFVVLGLLGTDANIRSLLGTGGAAPAGAWLVAAGLIFGLLGDQLLALRFICVNKKTQFFAAGAASFAVGHVLYIIARPAYCWAALPLASSRSRSRAFITTARTRTPGTCRYRA